MKLQMTDKQIRKFLEFWRDRKVKLPDPKHYPKAFQWYVKIYEYERKRNDKPNTPQRTV